MFFHKTDDFVQRAECMGDIARYNRDADGQRLVYILCINFRDGHVVFMPCLVDESTADPSLVFQGSYV